jgi:ligand-binding sensor domain-containing protein/signal transduction histidine kinase
MLAARTVIGLAVLACHGETLPIRSYTTAEGLAHDHVSRIYRDSHNFLWVCTDDGLSRFDGRRFVNYTVANGLPHSHVDDIIETRNGEYWVATDGGLARFRPNSHPSITHVYRPETPSQARSINAVVEDSDGTTLLGTGAGLYRLAGERMARVHFPSPPGVPETDLVNTLYLNGQGLWVGSATGLYWRNSTGNWSRFDTRHGLPHDFVDRIVSDPEGRIWLCTRQGLARLARNPQAGGSAVDFTLTQTNGLPHSDVRFIWFSADGRRWIGTRSGLVEWLGENFRVYTETHGLTDNFVRAIVEDPEGNLWLGTNRGGLMRLARAGFQKFDAADGLAMGSDDNTVVETRSGAICVAEIGNPRRPFHCYDGRRFETTFPRLPADVLAMTPTWSQATIQDHLGDWWLSSGRGTIRFGRGFFNLRLVPDRDSRSLYEDSRGDLWITTNSPRGFGLVRWERATQRVHDYEGSLPPAVRTQNINVVSEAPQGQIWIGLTSPGGLFRLRDNRFEPVAGIPEGSITALYPDQSHRLWIATLQAGLGRIDLPDADRPLARFYTRSQGLSANEVWSLTADREGRLYAGTYRGVDRLEPVTDRITHYSAADGLIPGDIRTALTDRNGNLWFLSKRGLSRLHPAERPHSKPIARITAIRIAGEPYPISELGETSIGPIEIPSSRNSVQVEYSAIDYGSPDDIRYEFRLEGAGRAWSDPDPNPAVQFASLAPGRYRLLVRAFGGDAAAAFSFRITPPVWRSWWFEVAVVLSLTAAFALWQRSKLRRQLALERVRAGIALDLHDDIGASLSRIAMMSEALKTRVNASDGGSNDVLGQIADESRRLVGNMSDIVWSVDPRRDTMGDLVARLRSFGSDVLEPRGIRWAFDADEQALKHQLSPNQRRQLYLILKEAIHNIARHSAASHAVVHIGMEGNVVCCDIEDDGCGLKKGSHNGVGIHSMHVRAKQLGGFFEIKACPSGGTRGTLRFPLSKRSA